LEDLVSTVLKTNQKVRFNQIRLQAGDVGNLLHPEIADELKLNGNLRARRRFMYPTGHQ